VTEGYDYGGEPPYDLSGDEPADVDEEATYAGEAAPEPVQEAVDEAGAAGLPETGDPQVDAVLSPLAGLPRQPVAEHVARFEQVHRGLQDALTQVENAENAEAARSRDAERAGGD
jgi:hypothetical protein